MRCTAARSSLAGSRALYSLALMLLASAAVVLLGSQDATVARESLTINTRDTSPAESAFVKSAHPAVDHTEVAEGEVASGVHMVSIYPGRQRVQTARDVEEIGLEQVAAGGSADLHEAVLRDRGNMQYFGQVQLGTPAKSFSVVFDTGSFVLWVPDAACKGVSCSEHRRFRVHGSTTGELLGVKDGKAHLATIKYGTGSMKGVRASDTVRVGTLEVAQSGVIVAMEERGEVFSKSPFDGVLGFSRRDAKSVDANGNEVHFNLMKSAKAGGFIKRNVVSFFLGYSPGRGGGAAILGGVDNRLYSGALHYHPVLRQSLGNWAVKMTRLYTAADPHTNFCPEAGCLAIADTGTSLLVGAASVAMPLARSLGVAQDCSGLQALPDIVLELEGEQGAVGYRLSPNDYTLEQITRDPVSGGAIKRCSSAFKAASSRIPLAFPSHKDMPLVILGDVFLRRYYAVFDNDDPARPRVGFAAANRQVKIRPAAAVMGL